MAWFLPGSFCASGRFPDTPILKRRPIAASSSIHLQISFLSIRFNFRISSLRCSTSIVLPILIIIITNIITYDYSPILLWFGRHRFYVCQSRFRPMRSGPTQGNASESGRIPVQQEGAVAEFLNYSPRPGAISIATLLARSRAIAYISI